ncbi:hypothetical protein N0V95_000535 [Ascochyta clinopodiicola]|nr:hypothetical protein N0V95_000535 [Ascochyta clinopodiicola]
MTLLVARQCRLLRAPHGPLPCLQRLASTTATARSPATETKDEANTAKTATPTPTPTPKPRYANKKLALLQYKQKQRIQSLRNRYPLTPKYEHSDIVPVHSAILIPASVTATPQHFVDKIEPVATALLAKRNLVVFLVTPSFAPWLLDDRVFLEKALDQLYKNITAPTPVVHAICAVVNKLPPATPLRGHDVGPRVGKRAVSPPVNETGFEGIAYVTLPAKAELSALPQLSGELGCIDFLAHTHTQAQGKRNDRIRVPLANTIFQTGETSTLIKSTWERRSDGVGFQMRSRTVRQAAAINLSAEDPMPIDPPHSHIYQEASALSIPLVPLTSPRQVDGHMGNIIRGVIKPDGSKMTASTELEHVVPRYFKARGEPAQATSAWALVIPKAKAQIAMTKTRTWLHPNLAASAGSEVPDAANDRSASAEEEETQESWEAFWQKDPPRWNLSIQQLIATGARLHKVLSGGGGWGKKAGLLSLDPVPLGAPEPRKQTSKEDEADDFDSVSDFSTALKPVVRDGDYIQFFISPKVTEAHDVSTFQHLKKLEQSTSKHAWSWEFGVVPSTVDSIPGGSWQHTTAASEEMVVFRGSFGALTEGSLTLMRGIRANTKTGIAQSLGTTSIDVPFSRWSGIRLFPKESQANDADSSTATKHQDSNTKPKVNIDVGSPP